MAVERIIGIDFGTSTSVIRVKRYENGKPLGESLETKEVIFGGSGAMVPTLIMKKDDDASVAYYGHEAQQKKRKFTNYSNFKVDLESASAEKRTEARKLTEEFFAFMGKQYRDQSNGGHLGNADDQERTIISYPVKWSEETKQFMISAAKKAGFPNVSGMDEAQAAIQAVTVMSTGYLQKYGLLQNGVASNILLIDMGAGTTDLVLCRHTPGASPKTELLTTWPKSGQILFGGKEIDALLKSFFWDKLDEADAQMVFKRIGTDKFKAWKEESVSPALRNNDSVSDFEVLDQCVEMMEIDMDEYCLDRAAFEKCLENYLKQLPVLINGCIENASLKGSDVDLVIVTGGHSQWYFVQEMLSGKMPQFGEVNLPKIKVNPTRIIPITRPQETVALGLVYSPMQSAIPIVPGPVPPKPIPPKPVPPKPPIEEAYTPESEFELLADGENYMIAKYTGNRKVVVIPPVIRGRKVTVIGRGAFARMVANPKLEGMSFWQRLKTSEPAEVNTCPVEKVVLPDTIIRIGEMAFYMCQNLHTVIAGKGLEKIGDDNPSNSNGSIGAFAGCRNLRTFVAGSNLKSIGHYTFLNCGKLSTMSFGTGNAVPGIVNFPRSLMFMGDNSLTGVPSIKEITINKGTKHTWKRLELGDGIVTYAAFDTTAIAVFYYD